MRSVLLCVSLVLFVNISQAARPTNQACDARGRSCVHGTAECINGNCQCKPPYIWGDGAFNCYKKDTVAAQVFNDPNLTNFNNESLPFPFPCRYLLTHVMTDLKKGTEESDIMGSCEVMVHAYNAKGRGKFFLHGFDVALKINYKNGATVKMSSRHYGFARNGNYHFNSKGTDGEFWQNGPWKNDKVNYRDQANGVEVQVYNDDDNNQLVYEANRCGVRMTFVPYDTKLRRAQVSIPGLSVAVSGAHQPRWLSNDEVMALAPSWQEGSLFADNQIPGLSVEQSIFFRAFHNEYVQNQPINDNGKCDAAHTSIHKCTRPELREAMANCYWMLKQPRFIYCFDKSQSGRNILSLFARCVRVWCAGESCEDVKDEIIISGCDTVHGIDELGPFMRGEMCPPRE